MDITLQQDPAAEPRHGIMHWIQPIALALLLLYFGLVYRSVMFTTEGVIERDGFYHARYSQMLPQRGFSRELPWMQFTDWKDHFCDKDFLYHVYLTAFTRDVAEPLPGAKIGTLLLLLLTLGALYFIIKKWNAPFALLWIALVGVGSAHFLNRMFMVRSHCLSVLLMVLATHIILKRRFWPCFATAFIYAWSYSVPLAMLVTACVLEFGRLIIERDVKSSLRMPIATAAGILTGLVIHPYSPNSLKSIWMLIEITRSGVAGSKVELGTEFQRMSLSAAFTVSIGSTVAALMALAGAIALFSGALKNRKLSSETAGVVILSTAWFISMFVSFERFIEYACPLAALACAFVARDMVGETIKIRNLSESGRMAVLGSLAAAVMALTGLHAWTVELNRVSIQMNAKPPLPLRSDVHSEAEFKVWQESAKVWLRGHYFDGASKWMRANLKPGTVVANFYWDDFPELFYSAPEMYYLVGLDPTIMRLQYPEKSQALEAMRVKEFANGQRTIGDKPIDFAEIKELFGTDYTILRRNQAVKYPDLVDQNTRQLKTAAAHGKLVFSDNEAVIYLSE